MLKDSWDPWQREYAVECLARHDLRSQPQILEALATAAREDPAVLVRVRAVCKRVLTDMGMSTTAALQTGRMDNDSCVHREAEALCPTIGTITEE
jgi:hypothetical protein